MSWRRRWSMVVALTVLASATLPGAVAAGLATRLHPSVGEPGHDAALPWIHVEHPARGLAYLADESGRQVILRGVVAAGLVDYWSGSSTAATAPPAHFPISPSAYAGSACPLNDAGIRVPPLCRRDLEQMSELGFTVVRLALSWSLLEPSPGAYSAEYLARVAQVVGWARADGIRVILDMHQNGYSRYVGRSAPAPIPGGQPAALSDHSGAPAWATFADGLPSEKFMGEREVNPAVFEAATAFWLNRDGIQDRYIAALGRLARDFAGESAVLGYGLYNEPWPGWVPPPTFDDLLLYPFYRRAVDALTGAGDGLPCPGGLPHPPLCSGPDLGLHDRRHLVFVDDGLVREITDFPTHLPLPFTSYPNVVLAMHAYTHIYTLDALTGLGGGNWPAYAQSYDWAAREARAMRAALFVSEYGNNLGDDARLLLHQAAEQDARSLGSTFWAWKENCGWSGTWGVYDGVFPPGESPRCAYDRGDDPGPRPASGCLRAGRAAVLGRAVPVAVPPGDFEFTSDPVTGAFRMTGHAARPGLLSLRLPPGAILRVEGGGVVATGATTDVALAGGAYSLALDPTRDHLPTGCLGGSG